MCQCVSMIIICSPHPIARDPRPTDESLLRGPYPSAFQHSVVPHGHGVVPHQHLRDILWRCPKLALNPALPIETASTWLCEIAHDLVHSGPQCTLLIRPLSHSLDENFSSSGGVTREIIFSRAEKTESRGRWCRGIANFNYPGNTPHGLKS